MPTTLSLVSGSQWFRIVLAAALLSLGAVGCGSSTGQNSASLEMLDGRSVPVEEIEAAIARVMESGAVPGLSCAILNDGKLKFLFPPGTRYGYSGEGIALLQMVVTEITGEDLEVLAQEKVFRLLVAILNAEGKRKTTLGQILEPQIDIDSPQVFAPVEAGSTDRYQESGLAWGLGWGRFDSEHGRAFFHTGHDFGWQNYTVTFADKGIGVVLLSNSDNFEAAAPQIVEAAIGDRHSLFEWLGYPPFDPSVVDKIPPPEPVAVDVDAAILDTYAGTYAMESGQRFRVKLEDNRLFIQGQDGQWTPLYAESQARFFVPESDYRFVFVVEEAGQVTGVSIEIQGLALPPAKKVE